MANGFAADCNNVCSNLCLKIGNQPWILGYKRYLVILKLSG